MRSVTPVLEHPKATNWGMVVRACDVSFVEDFGQLPRDVGSRAGETNGTAILRQTVHHKVNKVLILS